MSTYYFYVDIIKTVAVLLIINSHMDPIYPYQFLATGGALGNALFFAISGYLIRGKKKDINFWKKFVLRIYVPVTIVNIIYAYNPNYETIMQLIWPTNFWFVGAILLFYILFAVLEKVNVLFQFKKILLSLLVLYIFIYAFVLNTDKWVVETAGLSDVESSFKLIYYFGMMIIGAWLKEKQFSNKERQISKMFCITSLISFYASKFFIETHVGYMYLQFTSQLFTLLFAMTFFIWVTGINSLKIKGEKYISEFIKNISQISLELYLVQFPIIAMCGKVELFPINAFVSVVAIICAAKCLRLLSDFIIKHV